MAKRWTLPFMSLNGSSCRVDIYDDEYTGNTVQELLGSDDPVVIEEDNTQDLLSVVRVKTGSMNILERYDGELDDIIPEAATDRYVEIYYGNVLAFRGYIQQQSFTSEWTAYPHIVSIVFISQLGVMGSIRFNIQRGTTDRTIGRILYSLFQKLNVDANKNFQRVVFPLEDVSLGGTVRDLVICPNNGDFSPQKDSQTDPFTSITLMKFIEGICNAFGWMAHETANDLIFVKIDNPSAHYYAHNVADLNTLNNRIDIGTWQTEYIDREYTLAGSDGEINVIPPLKELSINYAGSYKLNVPFDFSRMRAVKLHPFSINDTLYEMIAFQSPSTAILTGPHLQQTNDFRLDGVDVWLTHSGVTVVNCNNDQYIVFQRPDDMTGYIPNLFTIQFDERPMRWDTNTSDMQDIYVKIEALWGDEGLTRLSNDTLVSGFHEFTQQLNVTLQCGEYTQTKYAEQFKDGDTATKMLRFTNVPITNPIRVTVSIYDAGTFKQGSVFAIKNVELRLFPKELTSINYFVDLTSTEKLLNYDGGFEEGSVDALISCRRVNSNMIGSQLQSRFTDYDYMFHNQTWLEVTLKGRMPNIDIYVSEWEFWNERLWRIVACNFTPARDEYRLTMVDLNTD